MDSVLDTKPPPFRILHQTPSSEVYWGKILLHRKCSQVEIFYNFYEYTKINVVFKIHIEIACSLTHEEILQDWEWLHSNLMDTLKSFDTEEEITEFVCCKIQSIIANNVPDSQFADGKPMIMQSIKR